MQKNTKFLYKRFSFADCPNPVWKLYEEAFPITERRPKPMFIETMKKKNFNPEVLYIDNKPVALLFWWDFGTYVYIEHLAVMQSKRNDGLGGEIINSFFSRIGQNCLVIIEVEKPEDEITRRRINFYKRHNMILNDYDYEQPGYKDVFKPLPLKLMTFPRRINGQEYKDFIDKIVPQIYFMAFGPKETFSAMNDLKPLCVDLDGTLLNGDSMAIAFADMFKRNPLKLFAVPLWLIVGGKYLFKQKIMENSVQDVSSLPYRSEVFEWLKSERERGRELVLATASMQQTADRVATYLGIFDRAVGSADNKNLRSGNKRDFLVGIFGDNGYDYAGNSGADLKVWKSADKVIFVGRNKRILRKVQAFGKSVKVFKK